MTKDNDLSKKDISNQKMSFNLKESLLSKIQQQLSSFEPA